MSSSSSSRPSSRPSHSVSSHSRSIDKKEKKALLQTCAKIMYKLCNPETDVPSSIQLKKQLKEKLKGLHVEDIQPSALKQTPTELVAITAQKFLRGEPVPSTEHMPILHFLNSRDELAIISQLTKEGDITLLQSAFGDWTRSESDKKKDEIIAYIYRGPTKNDYVQVVLRGKTVQHVSRWAPFFPF